MESHVVLRSRLRCRQLLGWLLQRYDDLRPMGTRLAGPGFACAAAVTACDRNCWASEPDDPCVLIEEGGDPGAGRRPGFAVANRSGARLFEALQRLADTLQQRLSLLPLLSAIAATVRRPGKKPAASHRQRWPLPPAIRLPS